MGDNKFDAATLSAGCLAVLGPLALLALAAVTASAVHAQATDPRAILKAMSEYVASQTTIEIGFDSDIEVITPQLEKIQFTNSSSALLSRPDKLRLHRVGGYADVTMVFDGTLVSIYGKHVNRYAQFNAHGTTDQLIEVARQGHGVAMPGADLLLSRSYEVLVDDVLEAKHIGRGVIDGNECEHLAFRNADTDWQLWVQVGDKPIPRKMVITSKTVNGAPQYTLRVTRWKTGVVPTADAFRFVPPANAQLLGPDALIGFDELPPDVPAKGEPK